MRLPLILFLLFSLIAGCTYTQKIRDGRTAFERHQFSVAIPMLEKDFKKEKSRVERGKIAYLLGRSHEELNQDGEAAKWFEIAYDNNYGVDALRSYAYALKRNEQYGEAGRAFIELGLEIGSPYEYRKDIDICEQAQEWKDNPRTDIRVENADFNSNRAEYAPALYGTDQLVITTDRASATGDDTYAWTGNAFSDLMLVDLNTSMVMDFDPSVNSPGNEGTAAFNQDGSEMIFTRCFSNEPYDDQYCKLMITQRTGSQWTAPVVLPFVQDGINYVHPALSGDGNTLYFASDDPNGWGGFDLYEVKRTPDGWSTPKLMSRSINTERDEQYPFVHADTLYFASNGHPGMGGLDMFRVYKQYDAYWSIAENLKPPFNSGADDFGLVLIPEADDGDDILQTGFFTSSRPGGYGLDDIYRYERFVPTEPDPVVEEPEEYKIFLNVYVLEKIYRQANDPNSEVLGRRILDNSNLQVLDPETLNAPGQPNEDGAYRIELEPDTEYQFLAGHEGYLSRDALFNTFGIGQDPANPIREFDLEIVLDKIYANQEITLENIYYDFDRWEIREDAKPTLNQLARDLQLNPNLVIQLASHTDCRGNARYNEDLSQRRAQSAVNYLIEQGIESDRLIAKGYGEDVPAVDCVCSRCTEEEHQENRRTTFTILE